MPRISLLDGLRLLLLALTSELQGKSVWWWTEVSIFASTLVTEQRPHMDSVSLHCSILCWSIKWMCLIGHIPGPSVQVGSVSQLCLTLCNPMDCSTPGLPITISHSLLKLMSIESVMPSNHLIHCHPLLLPPQSFPASGSFQMSQLFASGGQSTGVSASTSVFPVNTQDWSPLGLTGWISLQSKGLSRVFSNTTVQKHQFFGAQLSL